MQLDLYFKSESVHFSQNIEMSCKLDDDFNQFVLSSFYRHTQKDWGDVEPEHIEPNNQSLKTGGVILSAYKIPHNLIGRNLGCQLKKLNKENRLLIRTDEKDSSGIRELTIIFFEEEVLNEFIEQDS